MKNIVEIGSVFKDEKRDLIIINKEKRIDEYRGKNRSTEWVEYKCNKCGYKGWARKSSLINSKQGCACCRGYVVVEGINDIPTTAPWMVKYFQGGYDEAKLYTKRSMKKIHPICPDCGMIREKEVVIDNIYKFKSIGCNCGDNISYPEKFMFNTLEQLQLMFKTQLNKSMFDWCSSYKYDFYFEYNNEQYIIETHGMQHYTEKHRKHRRTLLQEQENDRLKKELALANGIKPENYIIINCSYSTLDWIKQNILNSRLNEIFDLNIINWKECSQYACTNLIKMVQELKQSDNTIKSIMNITKLSENTILRYCKK